MRKPRVLGRSHNNYYHVMSRVVDRRYIFGDEEKEFFRRTMHKLEEFTGIRILTYCIMSNHFHLLLEVPEQQTLTRTQLTSRITIFYSKQKARNVLQEFEEAKKHTQKTGNNAWEKEIENRYLSRMYDLSVFVKELKERFSKWYNRRHNRRGTLWEERFKSILIENSEHAISTIAAYIDLNPVRAGLVDDPRNYRYCGYGEAVAGLKSARQGISKIIQSLGHDSSWRKIVANYRMHLFSSGENTEKGAGFSSEEVKKTQKEGGELNRKELLLCRVRYFSDGVALGSRSFIENVFDNNRQLFSERRENGARKMRGGDWGGLFSLRDLKNAVNAPQ